LPKLRVVYPSPSRSSRRKPGPRQGWPQLSPNGSALFVLFVWFVVIPSGWSGSSGAGEGTTNDTKSTNGIALDR